eukprot:g60328.t1
MKRKRVSKNAVKSEGVSSPTTPNAPTALARSTSLPTKKPSKLGPDTTPRTQEELPAYQNKQLVLRLTEKKQEIEHLQDRLQKSDSQCRLQMEHVAIISRRWDQLHADLDSLAESRLGPIPADVAGSHEAMMKVSPLLSRFLGHPKQTELCVKQEKQEQMNDEEEEEEEDEHLGEAHALEVTELEKDLEIKCAWTARLLTWILTKSQHPQPDSAEQKLESLQAHLRDIEDQAKRQTQLAARYKANCCKLRKELLDTEEQLVYARRRIEKNNHANHASSSNATENDYSSSIKAEKHNSQMLAARLSELAELRKERDDLKVLLAMAEAAPATEAKVKASPLFQTLVTEAKVRFADQERQENELKMAKDKLAGLEQAIEHLNSHHKTQHQQLQEQHRAQVEALEGKLDELRTELTEAKARAHDLNLRVKELEGSNDTSVALPLSGTTRDLLHELSETNEKLQKELQDLREKNEATTQAREAGALFERIKHWKQKAEAMQLKVASNEKALEELSTDQRELVVSRGSEKALQTEVDKLKARVKMLEEERRKEYAADESAMETQKEVEEALMTELDEMAKSVEELQEQNGRLLQQATQREKHNSVLTGERINHLRHQALHSEAKKLTEKKIKQMQEKCSLLEKKIALQDETLKKTEEMLKGTQKKLREESEKGSQLLKKERTNVQLTMDLNQRYTEQKTAWEELGNKLKAVQNDVSTWEDKYNRCKEEKQALADELATERSKVMPAADAGLEWELKQLKARLRCQVCSDREKSHVIIKCMHMFCKECIDACVGNRNRKCPGCAHKFDKDHVKPIFFT